MASLHGLLLLYRPLTFRWSVRHRCCRSDRWSVRAFFVAVVLFIYLAADGNQSVRAEQSCQPPDDSPIVSENCDEDQDPLSTVQSILKAPQLLYGRILRKIPDKRFDCGSGTNVYTAEMQVYCILKGPQTQAIVNISESGYVPSRCYETQFDTNKNYVVITAVTSDGKIQPLDTELLASEKNLEEVRKSCRLEPKYPFGMTERNALQKCLVPWPPGECQDESYFTTTMVPSTTTEDDYDYTEDYGDTFPTDPTSDTYSKFGPMVSTSSPSLFKTYISYSVFIAFRLLWICLRVSIF